MPKRRRLNSEASESVRLLPKRSHTCPICSSSIPISEIAAHYDHERKQLDQLQPTNKRPAAVLALAKIADRPRQAKRTEQSQLLSRVRANRESRRKNENVDSGRVGECPVCGLELQGIGISADEHVSACLDERVQEERRREEGNWDVYQFGGQTRVRAIGLLEGGVR